MLKMKENKDTLIIVLLMFILCLWSTGYALKGCLEKEMCCPGRNSSCVVNNRSLNSLLGIYNPESIEKCYCDESCKNLGDCCEDYKEACREINCEVSDWGPWTNCSTKCGVGSMKRERRIIQEPLNGGEPCPVHTQRRACFSTHCPGHLQLREVGVILPAKYGKARNTNATYDVRENLRLRYPKDPDEKKRKVYCVEFEITTTSHACNETKYETWTSVLQTGNQICIECQDQAMRKKLGYRCKGHGVPNVETRWSAMNIEGCHGRWIRQGKTDHCQCTNEFDFIFV